jgi:hypothetical protein
MYLVLGSSGAGSHWQVSVRTALLAIWPSSPDRIQTGSSRNPMLQLTRNHLAKLCQGAGSVDRSL